MEVSDKGKENMKAFVAMDSFKGTLSSFRAGKTLERALKAADRDIFVTVSRFADGGEGSLDAVYSKSDYERIDLTVKDPLMRDITSWYGIRSGNTAVIELAKASGLGLVSQNERNPLLTTTYGLGQMIADALERNIRDFCIFIGGSATNDGGCGMLRALGYRFLDENGDDVPHGAAGLGRIRKIVSGKYAKAIKESRFRVACDVDNPLLGRLGATRVFSPQKGADSEMIEKMESGMENYALLCRETLGRDCSLENGAGAAGGIGFAFRAFFDANLEDGTEMIMEMHSFYDEIRKSDIVITGEGRFDGQSYMGKCCMKLIRKAKEEGKLTALVCGSIASEAAVDLSLVDFLEACIPDNSRISEAELKAGAESRLYEAGVRLAENIMNIQC